MSERVDHFAESLRQRLTTIGQMIDEAKFGLTEAKASDGSELRPDAESVRQKFETAKHEVTATESRMTTWLKAREMSGTAVVEGWKDECETRKLEHHAASAEDNAEAGIYLAEAAFVKAVVASYEAIDARRAAEQGDAA